MCVVCVWVSVKKILVICSNCSCSHNVLYSSYMYLFYSVVHVLLLSVSVKDIVDQNEDDENSCRDSLALLVDEPSDVNKDQRCLNITTIEDASFKCATQNFEFEMEPKSMMSPSQKRTALCQKLLLFLAGAMIVIGAGITSNFFSYQDPNLYNSTCNASSFYINSTGTEFPFVTTAVALNVTSAAGALPVTSPKYSCTASPACSANIPVSTLPSFPSITLE